MAQLNRLTDPAAVRAAIKQFDELGRDGFLLEYGFGEAREYFLVFKNRRYDSKAILAAAYGFQYPQEGPLSPYDFSGGQATVANRLGKLGFKVVRTGHSSQAQRDPDGRGAGLSRRLSLAAFDYVLDRNVHAEPRHAQMQERLRAHLRARGVEAVFELDSVDVQFPLGEELYIGEVKVTYTLRPSEAFRMALGQVLEYASLKFQKTPRMVIFLDCPLDLPRVDVAARLGVSVVVEGLAGFVLARPSNIDIDGPLANLFP